MTKAYTPQHDPHAVRRATQGFLDQLKLDRKALKEVGAEAGITGPDELKQLNEDIAVSGAHIVELNNMIMQAIAASGAGPYFTDSHDLAVDWKGNRYLIAVTFDEIL